MSWAEWALVYVGAGSLIVLIRCELAGDWRDALDVIGSIFLWPITLASYPPHRIKLWRQERRRQAHIAEKVASGEWEADYAREVLRWKG